MLNFNNWKLAVETRENILKGNSEQDISQVIHNATNSLEPTAKTEFEKYLSSLLLTLLMDLPINASHNEQELDNCRRAREILKWEI